MNSEMRGIDRVREDRGWVYCKWGRRKGYASPGGGQYSGAAGRSYTTKQAEQIAKNESAKTSSSKHQGIDLTINTTKRLTMYKGLII